MQVEALILFSGGAVATLIISYWWDRIEYHDPPEEKRTHLYETESGERHNPFSTNTDRDSAGDDGTASRVCLSCGSENGPEYARCADCLSLLPD